MVNNIFYFLRVYLTPAVHPRSYNIRSQQQSLYYYYMFLSFDSVSAAVAAIIYVYIHCDDAADGNFN